jgi:hypothetical protein
MHSKAALPALLAAILSLPISAQSIVKCSSKELPTHPFILREVSIQITELNGYKVFDRERKFSGRARLTLALENKSTQLFQKFDPQDLSFVGMDGVQAFPVFQRNLADDTLPMSLRLAPGARSTAEYALTGRLVFPVKVYVGDALVAEVSE